MVSEIQPGQAFSRRPPAHPDTMGENNTPTALKGCGVKTYGKNVYTVLFQTLQVDYYRAYSMLLNLQYSFIHFPSVTECYTGLLEYLYTDCLRLYTLNTFDLYTDCLRL